MKKSFEDLYRDFMRAGYALSERWTDIGDRQFEIVKEYPKYLPSFDEFMADMAKMLGEDFVIGQEKKKEYFYYNCNKCLSKNLTMSTDETECPICQHKVEEILGNCENCGVDYLMKAVLDYEIICPKCDKVTHNWDTTVGSTLSPMAVVTT